MSEPKTKEVSIQENKMGIMPVPRLLITMSLPMMISMLVQALYNIVDSMFVAKLSEDALTAVSLGTRVALAYGLSAIPAVGLYGVWASVPVGWLLADILGLWRWRRLRL